MAEKDITPLKPTPGEENNGGNGGEDPKGKENQKEEKVLTQEDVDRVAAKIRDEEKKKSDKAIAEAVKKAREDAIAESKLSEEERLKKKQQELEEEARNRDLRATLRENKAEALEELANLEIENAKELADLVLDSDLDAQKSKIRALKKAYDAAVEKGVARRTAGKPPVDPQKPGSSAKGKEIKTSL